MLELHSHAGSLELHPLMLRLGRSQPVPVCNLTETSILYPDVKHSWLCSGRLLRLENAMHAGNYTLFNQRWTLGQPVIISNASKNMKIEELWTPQAFSKEFGHIRHDLIDCRRNEPLTGYQIKHFWDGFEDTSSKCKLARPHCFCQPCPDDGK